MSYIILVHNGKFELIHTLDLDSAQIVLWSIKSYTRYVKIFPRFHGYMPYAT